MGNIWVDVSSGWLYGFPKLFDPVEDGPMDEWLVANGYPKDAKDFIVRQWSADDSTDS